MNPRLTPTQIEEILAASAHVDVPADQLLDAAAEIRAVLLAASGEVPVLRTPRSVDLRERRSDAPTLVTRRARTVRTTLVAAALALALGLSVAAAGALPGPIQDPFTRVANLFGLDLPLTEQPADARSGGGTPVSTGSPRPTSGPAPSTDDVTAAPTATTTETAETAVTDGPSEPQGNAYAYGHGEGNGNGPPETPGVPTGSGPPDDPGLGNGNAPPDDPGLGKGSGPPAEPGTGNGNNPDGPGP
jgi:hypothetical protein